MKSRLAPPQASTMIESLRGLGYSVQTALADIIDNSLAAKARHVDVQFNWSDKSSSITVLDDGNGMDDPGLEAAMRLGGKGPLDARDANDLGRFGLGLKTASFSQCRRLTVASRKDGVQSCLRWDLDVIAASSDGGWHLIEGPALGSESLVSKLEQQSTGTLVIWELLDRIVTSGFTSRDFLDLIDVVEQHLSMVFHRYLANPFPRLKLSINGKQLSPWDPFLTTNLATWSSPVASFKHAGGVVEIQCHVLPHRDKLDERTLRDGGGPDGWTAQQGFYVYRNQRLLLAGSWLGLGRGRSWTKEESHRLARIRVDIPNSADADWKIDIRKSTARPPVALREALTRLAEEARDRARKVFAHRGQAISRTGVAPVVQAWRAEHYAGGMRYRIEANHPAVRAVLDQAGPLQPQVEAMLKIIEQTIPVQRIWLDTAEAKETPHTHFSGEAPAAVAEILSVMYRNLLTLKQMSPVAAKAQLLRTDPFNNFPEIVAALPDELQ